MNFVKVPPGWTRKRMGNKIVYETDPPQMKIWNRDDFDRLKERGRFSGIDRMELNFSVKKVSEPQIVDVQEQMEVDDDRTSLVSSELGDATAVSAPRLSLSLQNPPSGLAVPALRAPPSVAVSPLRHAPRFAVNPPILGLPAPSLFGVPAPFTGRGLPIGSRLWVPAPFRYGDATSVFGESVSSPIVGPTSSTLGGTTSPTVVGPTSATFDRPYALSSGCTSSELGGGSVLDRKQAQVKKSVAQLSEDPKFKLDHNLCLQNAAKDLNNFRNVHEAEGLDLEEVKAAIESSEDGKSLLETLWNTPGLKAYFSSRESSLRLEELLMLASSKGPLKDFPPNINQNIYAELVTFGVSNCENVMAMLVNLLVKKHAPVQEKDVVRIGFLFSVVAHSVSRNNSSVAKLKSLVLQSQGLTLQGLDMMSTLGITETGRSTLNSTDLLAEVSDHLLRESSKTRPSQSTIDNLDFQLEHMTLEYKQFERNNTSHLDTKSLNSDKIEALFDSKLVMIDSPVHRTELEHFEKVTANTIGRLMGDRLKELGFIRKHLPLHYKHQNSDVPKTPADILIMPLECLQETVNSEMVEYLHKIQLKFLLEEVATGALDKQDFLDDLKIIQDTEVSDDVRMKAEDRVKKEVLRHGVWIGHGDLLTMKMFYVAKGLRQFSVTALERLDYLEIFRLELLHMKMAKVFQDYKFCLKNEQNLTDEGTLSWFATFLGFDSWVSNKANKIKKSGMFERHDQLFSEVATHFLVNAMQNYLKQFPDAVKTVGDEPTAEKFVLEFLKLSRIPLYFQSCEAEVDSEVDDMMTYGRDLTSRLVLSLVFDRIEKEEDPISMRGLRRIMIAYFLNRKPKIQDSKYAAFLILDMVLEEASSKRTKRRMDDLICCNQSGLPAGGLCRDKVIEIIVRAVKDKLRNLHSSMKDQVIDKLIASLSTVKTIVDYDINSMGFEGIGMQASYDHIGEDARKFMSEKVTSIDRFSTDRLKIKLIDKSDGSSPFSGMTGARLSSFVKLCKNNYTRNHPNKVPLSSIF